ncbi:hypothetical protein ACVIIV_005318 [Bradyrhizobium sp. USDA 4354]
MPSTALRQRQAASPSHLYYNTTSEIESASPTIPVTLSRPASVAMSSSTSAIEGRQSNPVVAFHG